MAYTLFMGLFAVGVAVVLGLLTLYRDHVIAWRVKTLLKATRAQYIKEKGREIQESLCKHALTVYVDDALDEAHERARLDYERKGAVYHWYPERSNEVVWLEGHYARSFNMSFALGLALEFCLVRYTLFRELSVATVASNITVKHLLCLLFPVLDTTTRVKQREELLCDQ